ncbi:P-loop containing nucleoside triphosphate hydrolase protein [Meredithblackwellia eburnea MCA 4105]
MGGPGGVGLPRELLPSEYVRDTIGVHTRWVVRVGRLQPPESQPSKVAKLLKSQLPDLQALGEHCALLFERLPLLLRFARDLARDNGKHFWFILAGKIIQSAIPAAELFLYTKILDMARCVPETGTFDTHLLAWAFTGRVGLMLASMGIEHFSERSENIINSRFSSAVQRSILRLHCKLDDNALALPEVQRQINLLKTLGEGSAYGRLFDPLAFIRVLNTGLSLVFELGVLYLKVNRSNRWLIGLSTAFMALQNFEWPATHTDIEHVDTTHDGFLRYKTLYQLGTSPKLRREVRTLGLQQYILDEAEKARLSVGTADTTSLATSPFDHARQQLHRSGSSGHGRFSWQPVLREIERPLTYAIFILVSASQPRTPGLQLLAFADVATLENANRAVYFRFLSLRGYFSELSSGLESMSALYEAESLEKRFRRSAQCTYMQSKRKVESGLWATGMKLELKNVSFSYSRGLPALQNVSFTILPGELIAIVGANGSGKTTLVSLLSLSERNYDGQILVNDIDIREYLPDDLARVMSFVFQASPSLPFALQEFISTGNVNIPTNLKHVEEALDVTGASQVVATLPQGLITYPSGASGSEPSFNDPWTALLDSHWELPRLAQTPPRPPQLKIGLDDELDAMYGWLDESSEKESSDNTLESSCSSLSSDTTLVEPITSDRLTREYSLRVGGEPSKITFDLHSPAPRTLSGGQWQRLVLSRSLFNTSADLFVWDEHGAALDPAAEAKAFAALEQKRHKATVLFSTHRLGPAAKADRIFVFDGGRLIESGGHKDLMALEGGKYRALWEVQANTFGLQQ